MNTPFTNIFEITRLSYLISEQEYSEESINRIGEHERLIENGAFVYTEISGSNLSDNLFTFFQDCFIKLGKEFTEVKFEIQDNNTILIEYRPVYPSDLYDWIDHLLLKNLENYGEILPAEKEGNLSDMKYNDLIYYEPAYRKLTYRPLRRIRLLLKKPQQRKKQRQKNQGPFTPIDNTKKQQQRLALNQNPDRNRQSLGQSMVEMLIQ